MLTKISQPILSQLAYNVILFPTEMKQLCYSIALATETNIRQLVHVTVTRRNKHCDAARLQKCLATQTNSRMQIG